MTKVIHKKPCSDCPFRQDAPPGWLGNYDSPEEFLAMYWSEFHIPCHTDKRYDDNLTANDFSNNAHCAGSLIMMKNECRLPRDKSLADKAAMVEPDPAVFGFPALFIDHHTLEAD